MKSAKRRRRNARASAKARESLAVYITVPCLREAYPVSPDRAKSRMMVLPWRQCTYVGITDFASSFCSFVLCQSSSHGRVGTLMDRWDPLVRPSMSISDVYLPLRSRLSHNSHGSAPNARLLLVLTPQIMYVLPSTTRTQALVSKRCHKRGTRWPWGTLRSGMHVPIRSSASPLI